MDDILFSEGTQSEIDNLFGVVAEEVVEEVVVPEPVVEEKKSSEIDLKQYVTEDFIDLLIDHARRGDVELVELKEEHGPEIVPELPEAPKPRTLMEDYSDTLGALSKKLKTEELVTEEDRLTSLETQLIQVRQLFREATMVSGIGQGGDGQTPGSGVVRAQDLDDLLISNILPGDTIIWDGNNFVPGAGGGGGGATTTAELLLADPVDGGLSFRSGTVQLHPNFPMAGSYTTQQDANILFTECLNYLELGKAMITVGPDIPTDEYISIGDLYIDDVFDMFVYNGNTWVQVGGGGGGASEEQLDEKVAKAGDTMSGDLSFKSLGAENYLKINSLRPDGWVSTDPLFGLEINIADGNTYKNQLRVRGRSDKEIVRLWIQDEQRIETNAILNIKPPVNVSGNTSFLQCRDTNNAISFSVGANGSVRAGTSTAPFIPSEDHHLVTKKFSDERLLDVQNQIDNLEASNLTTTTLNYVYKNTTPGVGEFTTNNADPDSVVQFNIDTRDSANRVLPTLTTNDVITTRLATGTAPVQTFTVADGTDPAAVTVVPSSTTANNYVDGETYILTVGHSFDGFATTDYVDTKVAITGDTMTGPLILASDPGTGLQAATKQYVDTTIRNNAPDLNDYIHKDGSVPMEGTLQAKNIDVGDGASLMFSDGNQYIKINNGRKLGIYGYRDSSFTSAWTQNIEVSHSLTEFKTVTKAASNFISTRKTGYAIEVKPDDVDTVGYWHTNGTMILKGQVVNTSGCFAVYPKGLSSNNANVAFSVTNQGQVRLGTAVTINSDYDIVHKKHVDQNFLPLTGGTLTGGLTQKSNDHFYIQNSSGTEGFRIEPSGFCRSMDLFRSERTDNGPAFQARNNTTLNAEIKCDGTATFKTSVKKDSKELATEEYVDNAVSTSGLVIQPAFMDFVWRSSQTQVVNAGYFNRGPSGSNQINVDYQTWSGMVWCTETNFTGDQSVNELFSVYKKNNDGSWEIRLVVQVSNITWGYRTDSFARRRMELKNVSIKMGSYSNLTDYGTYYCKLGGVF